jgi:hypothetical protein
MMDFLKNTNFSIYGPIFLVKVPISRVMGNKYISEMIA